MGFLPQMPKWKWTVSQSLKSLLLQRVTLGLICLDSKGAARTDEMATRVTRKVLENILKYLSWSKETLKDWMMLVERVEWYCRVLVMRERLLFSVAARQLL